MPPLMEDPELRALFADEVEERAARMIEAARLMVSGEAGTDDLEALRREAHTIKGTGRMMGFHALSEAGRRLEQVMQGVLAGERPSDPALGRAIERIGSCLVACVSADPEKGTPELAAAVVELSETAPGEEPEEAPVSGAAPEHDTGGGLPAAVPAIPDGTDGPSVESSDLGGLLVALDSWAFGETVRVNAANLFQLINGICSLRVDTEVLGSLVGEVVRVGAETPAAADDPLVRLASTVGAAEQTAADLQRQALDLAAAPLAEITNTFPQLVRYVARKAGRDVRFELVGDDAVADRQVLERVADALRQLLVNAVNHGIEDVEERLAAGKPPTATVALRAGVKNHKLQLEVEDDGRGVAWEAVRAAAVEKGLLGADEPIDCDRLRAVLFAPAFSTAEPGELVAEGNGLSDVAAAIEELHGTIALESSPGEGTLVTIVVPTSRALQDVVLITAAGHKWGIPEIAVLDRRPVSSGNIVGSGASRRMEWHGVEIPVRSFSEAVGLAETEPASRILVVSSQSGPVAFLVSTEIGARQVAARELGPLLDSVPHLTGAALLGGGDVVVLVDPSRLAERADVLPSREGPQPRVLVVDDSLGARQVVGGALGSAGFVVTLSSSAAETLELLERAEFDAIVMDYVLPDMDGATLVRKVRGLEIRVPIVMLSGLATPHDQARALAAGADAYFDKDDLRRGGLADALQSLIGGRPADAEVAG